MKLLPRYTETFLNSLDPAHRFYIKHYLIDDKLPVYRDIDKDYFTIMRIQRNNNNILVKPRSRSTGILVLFNQIFT